jgi:hypothetical protein
MPKRSTTSSERAPDQSALNKYLGTKDTRPHQRSLSSVLTKQPQQLHSRAPSPEVAMAIKDERVAQDVEMEESKPAEQRRFQLSSLSIHDVINSHSLPLPR